VNGDGYGDVVVGASGYDSGQTDEGRASLYLGAANGLSAAPSWIVESNQADARLGVAAAAGDVNGDGYADMVIGVPNYTSGQTLEGRALLYFGNAAPGRAVTPQVRRSDGGAPIAHLGRSDSESAFRLAARGLSPLGRGKVRLEWEVRPLGTPFTGTPTGQGAWTDTGTAGVALGALVSGLNAATPYTWRVRLRYHPTSFPLLPVGRWISQSPAGPRESAVRTTDLSAPTATVAQASGQADPAGIGPINFTVTFNEDVFGFGDAAADVSLGGTAGPTTAVVTGGPRDYNVAVSGMVAAGTVVLGVPAGGARDLFGNPNLAATAGDNSVTFFPTYPLVGGMTLGDATPTRAASVRFVVAFSKPVTGVDASDFALAANGVTGASITGVSGSGATWTVTVNSGSGSGTLRLEVHDDDTIVDGAGNKLGGTGQGNGAYIIGPAYTIDRAPPNVIGVGLARPPTGSTLMTFTVTYSDNLALNLGSLGSGDIVVSGPQGYSQAAALVSVNGTGAWRTVTYQVGAPGGTWGSEDAGIYTFTLAAGAVTDSVGNATPARTLGTLLVTYIRPVYMPLVVK
jgi:hypothetical protein